MQRKLETRKWRIAVPALLLVLGCDDTHDVTLLEMEGARVAAPRSLRPVPEVTQTRRLGVESAPAALDSGAAAVAEPALASHDAAPSWAGPLDAGPGSGALTGDASPEPTGLDLAERYPIAFRSHQGGSSSNLYIMTLDGSDVRPVTRGGNYFLPRWSPDGRSLAFRHVTESVNAEAGLVAANGDQPVLLTQGEHVNLWSFAVNWSPDGERLSHGSVRAVTALWVWQMARSGGQQRRLLPEIDVFQREAVWSRSEPPRLAFIDTDRSTIAQDVWVVAPDDASQALNLTHGQIAAPSDVRWSPDGRRLAFAGYPVQADGAVEGTAGHRDAGAFAGQAAPNCEVFVVDVETGELTRVTQAAAYDREPTWSPDGQHLLFASDRVGSDDLWLVALDDPSMVRRLTELAPSYDKTSPDWYWGPR